MKRREQVTRKRDVNTYALLWAASWAHRQHADNREPNSYYSVMAAIIFAAFTFEAFLNHVGGHLFADWDSFESLSPKEKFEKVQETVKSNFGLGERPGQSVSRVLDFRNDLAHGKTIQIAAPTRVEDERHGIAFVLHQSLETDWEKFCTLQNLHNVHADLDKIMSSVFRLGKLPGVLYGPGLLSASGVPLEIESP